MSSPDRTLSASFYRRFFSVLLLLSVLLTGALTKVPLLPPSVWAADFSCDAREEGGIRFYVSPAGDDENSGERGKPWRTLAKANQTLMPGDTVFISSGTYTDPIRPRCGGTGPDTTQRIVYRAAGVVKLHGVDNTTGPSAGAISVGERNYVSVLGGGERRFVIEPQEPVGALVSLCGGSNNVVSGFRSKATGPNKAPSRIVAFCLNYWTTDKPTENNHVSDFSVTGWSTQQESDKSQFTEDGVVVSCKKTGPSVSHNVISNGEIYNVRHSAVYADCPHGGPLLIDRLTVFNKEHTACSVWSYGAERAADQPPARVVLQNSVCRSTASNADPPHGEAGAALQWGSPNGLIRNNIIFDGGSSAAPKSTVGCVIAASGFSYGAAYSAAGTAFFRNTLKNCSGPIVGRFQFDKDADKQQPFGDVFFLGNMFVDNGFNSPPVYYWDTKPDKPDIWKSNVFVTRRNSVITAENQTLDNSNLYVSAELDEPYSGPVAIMTAAAHTATKIKLSTARFFYDFSGYPESVGLRPDRLKINGQESAVTAVDIKNNEVELATPVTANAGAAVYLLPGGVVDFKTDPVDLSGFNVSDSPPGASNTNEAERKDSNKDAVLFKLKRIRRQLNAIIGELENGVQRK